MNTIDITKFETANEWIVEKFYDGVMHVIGKVLLDKTLHLCNAQLEVIWDLCNFGCSQPEPLQIIDDSARYGGMTAYKSGDVIYVPLSKVSWCNDDIFIRKHFDTDEGYCISNNDRRGKDEWVYLKRENFLNMMRTSRFTR